MNIDFARKLELAYHQQCKNLCNEFHLKQTGFDILMFLGNNPQYKHAKDIVEIRKIKANLVSIHVDQLVDQGYLSRIDVPGDRRKVELVLNKKANDVIKKGKAFQNHFFSSLFSDIEQQSSHRRSLFHSCNLFCWNGSRSRNRFCRNVSGCCY